MSEWISVKESLPGEMDWAEDMLLALSDGRVVIGFYVPDDSRWCDSFGDWLCDEETPQYWMRVPAHPKEAKG